MDKVINIVSKFQVGKQLNLWQKMKSHLKNDFKIPVEDPLYNLRFLSSIQFATEVYITAIILKKPTEIFSLL